MKKTKTLPPKGGGQSTADSGSERTKRFAAAMARAELGRFYFGEDAARTYRQATTQRSKVGKTTARS